VRTVFPAEPIVFRSRGLDRTLDEPTRTYETPSGQWSTADRALVRLLHQDVDFLLGSIARLRRSTPFVATSPNYGSNPYYCILQPDSVPMSLFHLEQEVLDEEHFGLAIETDNPSIAEPVVVKLEKHLDTSMAGRALQGQLILTAPAIVWNGAWVGWEAYTRATYDCRHVVAIQYVDRSSLPNEFDRARSMIQRLQLSWSDRDRYVNEVLDAAANVGFAGYERGILGLAGSAADRSVLVQCHWYGRRVCGDPVIDVP
jgi:hypothetical protein